MAKKYTAEERAEAVKLAREIGNRAAADRLDISIDTLYNWLSKEKSTRNKRVRSPHRRRWNMSLSSCAKLSLKKKPNWKYYRMH